MSTLPTLDLAMATWKPDGISRVAAMNLPQVDGVRYVVSWQASADAPIPAELAARADVSIHRTDAVGVAANRNNALEHCTADVVLHSDDDLVYSAEGLQAVRRAFAEHKDVDLAVFQYDGDDGKNYPAEECDLAVLPKNFWVATFQLAVRRDSAAGVLRFNTAFGPGAEFTASGEDEVYLLTARRRGISCRFFPITITTHCGITTGQRAITNAKVLHGMGAVIRLSYPRTALLRILLKAWRMWRSGQCAPAFALRGLLRGWHFAAAFAAEL
jgi:glycosyltransferase involved in cell wall biosynthesis